MKPRILDEIRRLAEERGKPPGSRQFTEQTGIGESSWRGVYWARWSDALKEAGLPPNATPAELRIDDNVMLEQLALACRHFGRIPTVSELRLHRRSNPALPDTKAIDRRFDGFKQIGTHIRTWAASRSDYADIALLLAPARPASMARSKVKGDGSVYLIRSGEFCKIGRSDELEQRVKRITVALPDAAELVHAIQTDDPPGIEAYWHRRFADKRANGEWFKLTRDDISAFRRRRFQ